MNLHQIVRGAVTSVNPDTAAIMLRSTGYTTAADGIRTPTFDSIPVTIQVQALGSDDLRQLDGLNIQGQKNGIYLNGQWNGVVRVGKQGGDLIKIGNQTWLAVKVLENWPDFTHLAVVLQDGS